jgi:hypothetical protein
MALPRRLHPLRSVLHAYVLSTLTINGGCTPAC